jgi:hypothetical protein
MRCGFDRVRSPLYEDAGPSQTHQFTLGSLPIDKSALVACCLRFEAIDDLIRVNVQPLPISPAQQIRCRLLGYRRHFRYDIFIPGTIHLADGQHYQHPGLWIGLSIEIHGAAR